jgi:hypothetical protein
VIPSSGKLHLAMATGMAAWASLGGSGVQLASTGRPRRSRSKFQCVKCGCEIPAGKPNRACKTCRAERAKEVCGE